EDSRPSLLFFASPPNGADSGQRGNHVSSFPQRDSVRPQNEMRDKGETMCVWKGGGAELRLTRDTAISSMPTLSHKHTRAVWHGVLMFLSLSPSHSISLSLPVSLS